jgi:hypothetical protein
VYKYIYIYTIRTLNRLIRGDTDREAFPGQGSNSYAKPACMPEKGFRQDLYKPWAYSQGLSLCTLQTSHNENMTLSL